MQESIGRIVEEESIERKGMSPNMPESGNIHWTDDENLVARFVLGQLDPQELEGLEKHLRDCERCQSAVRKEQQIAAGVRRAGRDTLKRRLAQRVEQSRGSSLNWYRAVGVAAVVILLVTVGIYNHWFVAERPQGTAVKERAEDERSKVDLAHTQTPQPQIALPDRAVAEAAKPNVQGQLAPARAGSEALDKSAGAGPRKVNEPESKKAKGLETAQANRLDAESPKRDRYVPQAAGAPAEEIWVEGSYVVNQNGRLAAGQALAKSEEDAKDALLKNKMEGKMMQARPARSQVLAEEQQNVTFTQRRTSDLPAVQRSNRQAFSSVQTLLQKISNGVRMTLYLDSLVDSKELGQARIQRISEDSIILNVGNQRIGYKLPAGWNDQMSKQIQKAK